MIKAKYSEDVDALLIELSDKRVDAAEEHGPYIFHYADDGDLVLLEILGAREFVMSVMEGVFESKAVSKG
jgi:uncharacterized protein YuzE